MRRSATLLTLAPLIAFSVPLLAQTQNGNLYLTIQDDLGIVQAGVEAVLTGQDFARTVTSDREGRARFIELTPGAYELTLRATGFNTMILQWIQIDSGANADLDVTMVHSDYREEVVVTARTPLLNKREMGTSTTFTKSEIEQVPTARDPWSVMSTVPGITTDRVNVAGSEAGQQSGFVGKGVGITQTMWKMDGVEFTDLTGPGGSSTYLDFNSFEQIGFTTAGGDVSAQTGGIQMEFVTKQGSNHVTGTARLLYTDSGLQGENNSGLEQPEWNTGDQPIAGNSIDKLFEKNFDIGGPLLSDRLWWWFGFTNNDINIRIITGDPERSELQNISGKLHGQWTGRLTYKAFYTVGEKNMLGRGASISRPPEATVDQGGSTPIWGGSLSYFFSPDLEATFQYSKVDEGFEFRPNGDFSKQIFLDENGVYRNTAGLYETERPQDQYLVTGHYFFDTGSWDHELKFGFRYKDATVESFSKYSEADMLATKWIDPDYRPYVNLYREYNIKVEQEYTNVWIGDTVLKGPWAINAGVHYSRQTGRQAPSAVGPNGTFPTLVRGVTFSGADPGFVWEDLNPRVGVTYTFDWERRLLLRASYGRYADQLGTNHLIFSSPVSFVAVAYWWNDLDGDDVVDNDELYNYDRGTGTFTTPVDITSDATACESMYYSFNLFPCNTGTSVPYKIDTNLSAPRIQEFLVGADWEVAKDFVLGFTFVRRERDNAVWAPFYDNTVFENTGRLQTIDNRAIYSCDYLKEGSALDGRPYSENYCEITDDSDLPPGDARWETNSPEHGQSYNGFELVATKRLSDRWRLRGFVSYSRWEQGFSGPTPQLSLGSILPWGSRSGDPTNYRGGTTDDGGLVALQTREQVFLGSSNWQFNVNGMYQLPKGWAVSGNLYGRQGFGLPYFAPVWTATGGRKEVQVDRVDTERYDDLYMLDLRVSKLFALEGEINVELAAELFNALNENTVIQQGQNMASTTYQQIEEIVSPRIWRFVATVNF